MSWHDSPLAKHWQSMTYQYGWKCKCGEEIHVTTLNFKTMPECLMCDSHMYMTYSINPAGEIWMNAALLLEDDYE